MRHRKVIPISIGEQARLGAVCLLRDLADEIECMGPDRLDDVLLRIPFGELKLLEGLARDARRRAN